MSKKFSEQYEEIMQDNIEILTENIFTDLKNFILNPKYINKTNLKSDIDNMLNEINKKKMDLLSKDTFEYFSKGKYKNSLGSLISKLEAELNKIKSLDKTKRAEIITKALTASGIDNSEFIKIITNYLNRLVPSEIKGRFIPHNESIIESNKTIIDKSMKDLIELVKELKTLKNKEDIEEKLLSMGIEPTSEVGQFILSFMNKTSNVIKPK